VVVQAHQVVAERGHPLRLVGDVLFLAVEKRIRLQVGTPKSGLGPVFEDEAIAFGPDLAVSASRSIVQEPDVHRPPVPFERPAVPGRAVVLPISLVDRFPYRAPTRQSQAHGELARAGPNLPADQKASDGISLVSFEKCRRQRRIEQHADGIEGGRIPFEATVVGE
jgi:hypothetical protein